MKNTTTHIEGDFGVRWQECNRRDEIVLKEKFFSTAAKRETFMGKLEKKENFVNFYATSDNPFN